MIINLILKIYNWLNKERTPLYDPVAIEIIRNSPNELRSIIDEYQATGVWDYERLNKLFSENEQKNILSS